MITYKKATTKEEIIKTIHEMDWNMLESMEHQ